MVRSPLPPPTPLATDTVHVYNTAMDTIANLAAQGTKHEPLISQLKTPLNNLSKAEQLNVVQKGWLRLFTSV